MNVEQFLGKYKDDPEKITVLALSVDTKVVYLRQIASGFRKAGHQLALKMHRHTDGEIHVMHTRPDIYPPFLFDEFHAFKLTA